ncbi:MAG: RIP metalloprotease RseP [Nitrospiria bacterium]
MFSASTVLTFIIVLGVLVGIHEFGHFIVARMCGVQVQTFSLGFGPKIASKKVGPTEYCLSIIPLGGYVRMLGDDPNEEIPDDEKDRSFLTQPVRKKIAIVIAGPLFNLLLAAFIYSGIYMVGFPTVTAVIGQVQENSAAEAGGMQAGDEVLTIENRDIADWDEVRETVQKSGGKPLHFLVHRDGKEVELNITPRLKESKDVFGDAQHSWLIGITPKGDQITKRYNPVKAVYLGVENTIKLTYLTVKGIARMIQGKISSDSLGGPILIAQIAGEQAQQGFSNVVLFVAMLSINLGVLNLFPIPVLDGGHLVFFSIEGIMGRPLSLKMREIAQQVGLFLIISLMVFAFYNDIMRIFVNPG